MKIHRCQTLEEFRRLANEIKATIKVDSPGVERSIAEPSGFIRQFRYHFTYDDQKWGKTQVVFVEHSSLTKEPIGTLYQEHQDELDMPKFRRMLKMIPELQHLFEDEYGSNY